MPVAFIEKDDYGRRIESAGSTFSTCPKGEEGTRAAFLRFFKE
jgi:hypothetical protein